MWIQELRALRRSAFIGGDEVSKLIDGQIRIVGVKGNPAVPARKGVGCRLWKN